VTFGVAKDVTIHSLRTLDATGVAPWSAVIAAIDWITANHQSPAVVNLSIQGPASDAVDNAIRRSIAAGVTYVIAAGNSNLDNAGTSPGRTAEAITVGATDASDERASFSNYGPGVDVFAPGVGIQSSYFTSDNAAALMSGTSMAAPHVSGVAAVYLGAHPAAPPAEVRDALVAAATRDVITSPGNGSPNRLLYSAFLLTRPPTPPAVAVVSPNGGERLTSDAPFVIRWNANDPDGLDRFDVAVSTDDVNYSPIPECSQLPGSARSCMWHAPGPVSSRVRVRVLAYDRFGAAALDASNAPFAIAAPPPPSPALPAAWTSADIGAVGARGSASYADGLYTVTGSGADVWGTADELQFVHHPITGNFTIDVHVAAIENRSVWTKAGVMMRESLAPGARHATLFATPTATKGIAFQRRPVANQASVHTSGPRLPAPGWLRLVREGNIVQAFFRTSMLLPWTAVGQQSFSALADTVHIGLAVSSHVDGLLATAIFGGVDIQQTAPVFTSADIGAVGAPGTTTASGGVITIEGGGADIWGTADALRYYSRPLSGDGTITVRVRDVENVAAWTKVGVMFRESTAPGSKHVMLVVSPGKGLSIQLRPATGGISTEAARSAGVAPEWLRLQRIGNTFHASASENGTAWRTLGSVSVDMATTALVGLPVSSHKKGVLAAAVFDNLSVQP
jgi:regulation of enolase protein 1 (concanavalin A-like superfamily)